MPDVGQKKPPTTGVSRRRWLRRVYWCIATGLVMVAGSVLAAGWLPLGVITPWAQLVAFRPQLGVGLLALAGITGLVVRALRSLCLVLAVLAATSAATLVGRVSGTGTTAHDRAVTVLSSNVMADGATVKEIVNLAVVSRVDAIVLPRVRRPLWTPCWPNVTWLASWYLNVQSRYGLGCARR